MSDHKPLITLIIHYSKLTLLYEPWRIKIKDILIGCTSTPSHQLPLQSRQTWTGIQMSCMTLREMVSSWHPGLSINTGKINGSSPHPHFGGLCRGGKQHELPFDFLLTHIYQLAGRPHEKIPPTSSQMCMSVVHACSKVDALWSEFSTNRHALRTLHNRVSGKDITGGGGERNTIRRFHLIGCPRGPRTSQVCLTSCFLLGSEL